MQRCQSDQADLMLDTWGWRCMCLADAEAVHHTLAGYQGASWPHWSATVQRLREDPAGAAVLAGQAGGRDGRPAVPLGWGDPRPPLA